MKYLKAKVIINDSSVYPLFYEFHVLSKHDLSVVLFSFHFEQYYVFFDSLTTRILAGLFSTPFHNNCSPAVQKFE